MSDIHIGDTDHPDAQREWVTYGYGGYTCQDCGDNSASEWRTKDGQSRTVCKDCADKRGMMDDW